MKMVTPLSCQLPVFDFLSHVKVALGSLVLKKKKIDKNANISRTRNKMLRNIFFPFVLAKGIKLQV